MTVMPPTAPPPAVAGAPERLSDRVVRVLAPNPSIMTGPGTNTYVVGGSEGGRIAIIDPGPADPGHVDAILDVVGPRPVSAICVTHHHADHWPAAYPLVERLAEVQDARVRIYGRAMRGGFEPTSVLPHAAIVAVDDATLRAEHTPGHASDHLCFLLQEEGALFTGDHVMGGSTVVIAPPDGNMARYLDSLRHLQTLEAKRIYPAHGGVIEDPAAMLDYYIEHRIEREGQVLEALRSGLERVSDIVESIYTEVAQPLRAVAYFSVLAHLLDLRERELVEAFDDDDNLLVDERPDVPADRLGHATGGAEAPRSWMPVAPPPEDGEADPANPELPLEVPPLMGARFRVT